MAQSVEQLTRNEQVGGSIPPSSSTQIPENVFTFSGICNFATK